MDVLDVLEREKELITIRGVVAPSEWDVRDEVTAVTVYAHDETEYVVNAKYMVKRLMKHMDEEVQATGVLSEDEYGNDVFIMSDFTVVEEDKDASYGAADDDDVEDEDEEWDEGDEWEDSDEEEEEETKGTWKRYQFR